MQKPLVILSSVSQLSNKISHEKTSVIMAMPMPKVGRYDFQSFRLVKMLLTEQKQSTPAKMWDCVRRVPA